MGRKFSILDLDPEKENIIDELQKYFKNELPRNILRKLSCEELRSNLSDAIVACSSGRKLFLVKVK